MSTVDTHTTYATTPPTRNVSMKFEELTLPVADIERAKAFYQQLGWRFDSETNPGEDFHAIQMTPPHSDCSIAFGIGLINETHGPIERMLLAVEDIEAARADLLRRGVQVTEPYHFEKRPEGSHTRVRGADPERRSYASYASFTDPDGNGWLLQEITDRLPGRLWNDVG
jgi:catechol 2,3-dioxygenase-like lactoylglutathione lyase family enzyme